MPSLSSESGRVSAHNIGIREVVVVGRFYPNPGAFQTSGEVRLGVEALPALLPAIAGFLAAEGEPSRPSHGGQVGFDQVLDRRPADAQDGRAAGAMAARAQDCRISLGRGAEAPGGLA
ncbi:MAG: hypothetical protein ACYCO3_09715 [Mycobacteriales bacterium]